MYSTILVAIHVSFIIADVALLSHDYSLAGKDDLPKYDWHFSLQLAQSRAMSRTGDTADSGLDHTYATSVLMVT
jgi:hypothetical protein